MLPNCAKLQFATSSILVMHMQFFYLISIIYNFHMHRYFAKQKSCILKLLYVNTVYNLHRNYSVVSGIFNLFNKVFIQTKLDSLTLLPHPFYRCTVNFVSSWEIFRHCKVVRQYALFL